MKAIEGVTLNAEQELYVIPCGEGYTCLGYDVCMEHAQRYANWLGETVTLTRGTLEAYSIYRDLCEGIRIRYEKRGERCPVDLTPELIGLEGKHVEVVDAYDERRRFIVGKSAGWIPIHLEIERLGESGGCGVTGTPFKSVRVIR